MTLTRRGLLQGGIGIAAANPMSADVALSLPATADSGTADMLRERLLLDFSWRFHLGHASDPAQDFGFGKDQRTFAKAGEDVATAADLEFDDSGWTEIALPHDWAVGLPFVPPATSPPTGQDDPRAEHGFKPLGRDYPETSIGWYRRTFALEADDFGKRISLEFDGVFRNCLVMFNGYVVGGNESGYAPFRIDVTDFANYGGNNVLVLRVDATLGEGWFYEGAGIYRHVWLVKTAPVHVAQWGVCARPVVTGTKAAIALAAEVANDGDTAAQCTVVWNILDPAGQRIGAIESRPTEIASRETHEFNGRTTIAAPALWSIEAPNLYRLVAEVRLGGRAVDRYASHFGIRSVRFDPALGFFLNGKSVKIKGTCNHQDHAGVGSALPDRLHTWRIEKLKALGSNAYRTAHNPPAPELLDACDRLGMLVLDETRMMSSDDEGMSQLSRMIRRDRNHPSIILWSLGNEEPQQGTPRGARVARSMKRLANRLDPTRPCTIAMDKDWGEGVTAVIDVVGFNYRTPKMAEFHQSFPAKPVVGTETGSTVCTRGIYARDDAKGFVPTYDTDFPWWASTAEAWWSFVAPRPFIAGGFVWTGFDYRGEPTPFNRWPNVSSQFGIMDSCGFPKDNWFYYRAWWSDEPLLHLLPHWNWEGHEGQLIAVWCHTNLARVELFLNGQSLGTRDVARNSHAAWMVPYAPGVLEARGVARDGSALTARRETTRAPAAIRLSSDRVTINAEGEDVAVVTAEVVDAQGRVVPTAGNEISFAVSGPGTVIGVGNGDPTSHEQDKATTRRAFNSLCVAIVQSSKTPGQIRVDASSPGLVSGALLLEAAPAKIRAFVG
ncbi:MAG: beta-galactosidase GalA [Rhizomicrobium sp.]|jgi:beta-galactosidase